LVKKTPAARHYLFRFETVCGDSKRQLNSHYLRGYMKKTKRAVSASAFCAFALLSGCETTNPGVPYQTSTENVIAIQQNLQAQKVSVSAINLSPGVDDHPMCRLNGPLTVAPGKTLGQYIKDAFVQELFAGQAYSPNAPAIQGQIESLNFSSVTPASWKITMSVKSATSAGYTVSIKYPFDTSWTAAGACRNVATAFAPAVSELLHQVVIDPRFAQLAGK
jgi:hypothetical protein